MDNRETPDPSRGPRRYGPSARNPQPPADGRQPDAPRAWSEVDRQGDPSPGQYGPAPQYPPAAPGRQGPPRQGPPRQGPPRQGPPPTAVFPAGQGVPVARPPGAPRQNIRPGGPAQRPGQQRPVPVAPQSRPHLLAGRILAAALSVAILIATGVIWGVNRSTGGESKAVDKAGTAGVVTDENGTPVVQGQNILLVGSDSRTDAEGKPLSGAELAALGTTETDGVNTDTIMVIHIPKGGGKATSISIPRDTWIYDPPANRNPNCVLTGGPYDYSFPNKINSYYGVAKACEEYDLVQSGVTDKAAKELASNEKGREVLIDAVQRLSGLKIDQYAEVNLFGFYLLSEAIGGVPVCLVNDVKDPDSGADFKAGPQEVSGSAALAFVRQRHGLPGGDLDRVRRQQAFLSGALDKVLSAKILTSPSELTKLIEAANRSIVLSDGFSLLDLASQMANLSSGNVNFLTIPTLGGRNIDGKDALDVDPEAVKAFFATMDSATGSTDAGSGTATTSASKVDPASVVVDVLNGTNTAGMASAVADAVAGSGFSRGQIGDYQGDLQSSTSIHFAPGDEAAAAAVKKALGYGSVQSDDTVDSGHVLVVVGGDAPAPPSSLRSAGLFLPVQQNLAQENSAQENGAPTTTASDPGSINAAAPGCVN